MGSWGLVEERRGFTIGTGLVWFGVAFVAIVSLGLSLCQANAAAADAPQALWTRCAADSEVDTSCQIPRGIAADPKSGHVFVADQSNRRIVVFSALGTFLRTWGWDVVASGPDNNGTGFEICVPANGDTCKAGVEGTGTGQFLGSPQGVAVDSAGNVYVVDRLNYRVQKFDPEGNFLLTFGGKVNKTKVEAAAPEAEQNLCTAASGNSCQAGVEGTGNGQFAWPITLIGSFIAIDTKGTETSADDLVYVGDQSRIQVFDAGGQYFKRLPLPGETVRSLAVDSGGDLYAVYSGKANIHKLGPEGEQLLPSFEVEAPSAVAVDSLGHVYAFDPSVIHLLNPVADGPPIFEFDADGSLIANFGKSEFADSTGLATNLCPGDNPPGNLYVSNASAGKAFPPGPNSAFVRAYGPEPKNCGKAITTQPSSITETGATLTGKANPRGEAVTKCLFEYGTSLTYGQTAPCGESSGEIGTGTAPVPVHADIGGLAAGTVYHVRLVVGSAGGTEAGSDETFKTLGPPVLSNESASNVAYTEVTLKALVNPEGFATKYHFEYGLDKTYGQSTAEIGVGSDRNDHQAIASLKGLQMGTTYHWRVVATNSSGTTPGPDHVFTTFLEPTPLSCPDNQAFRIGPSAALPDCRAYEMVSPVDKNGGDIVHILGKPSDFAGGGYVQTSRDGERLTYSTAPAFGDVLASLPINQYLATREDGVGWLNHGIHPPLGDGKPLPETEFGLSREFEAFSPDLCSAWFEDDLTPPLTAEGQRGFPNIYRLGLCGGEAYEAVTTAKPPLGTQVHYLNIGRQAIAGFSEDGSHAFFAANAALTPNAAPNSNAQIYDRFGGDLHLVSVLPSGSADPAPDGVGSNPKFSLDNAVSADGSHVYWTSFQQGTEVTGLGRIFLRRHPEQGKVEGECNELAKACTTLVAAGGVTGAFFWAGAADGSGALYGEPAEGGEKLFLQKFEQPLETKPPRTLVAEHVNGVLGASDDLSRIYFVSTNVLTPGQKNGEEDEAQAGEPNLYLDDGGVKTYIATLIPGDLQDGTTGAALAYNVVAKEAFRRPVRVSSDGTHMAFESRAPLTGFDNTDSANGKADVEVFTYEAGGALDCVSCNPSGARPSGAELHEPYVRINSGPTGVFASAWIPTWEHPLYASHVLSDDGRRLFFQSYEALVPSDTNGAMDVYEWEAPGTGSCTQESHVFHAANGGCVSLISSGESSFESEFWDASADGRDVFFSTASSLVPQDTGLIDLYDARAGGGFPPPPSPPAPCEGEACQSPPAPPRFGTPASRSYTGPPSNPPKPPAGKPCPKGKHKVRKHGKTSCVKTHKHHHRRTSHNRRAGR